MSKFAIAFAFLFSGLGHARDFLEKDCAVVGNIETHIFFVKGCPNYSQMLEGNKGNDNRKCFKSRDEAASDGFRIAKNCRKEVYIDK